MTRVPDPFHFELLPLRYVMNPTPQGGGLSEPRFMTSPSGGNPLRSRGHGTPGCWPVPDPAAGVHAAVSGDTAKDTDTTSLSDMDEAHFTGPSKGRD